MFHDASHPVGGYLGAYVRVPFFRLMLAPPCHCGVVCCSWWQRDAGFGSGLLLQLAEDLRLSMPAVFGEARLVSAWAYKYGASSRVESRPPPLEVLVVTTTTVAFLARPRHVRHQHACRRSACQRQHVGDTRRVQHGPVFGRVAGVACTIPVELDV